MRKLILFACAGLVACVCIAGPKLETSQIKLTAVGVVAGTNAAIKVAAGYVEEVSVHCSDNTSTGVVSVVVNPADATATAYNLATGTATATKRWYPRVDGTGTDGTGLSSDPPWRYLLIGDTITFAVTASEATNVTWTLRIKLSDN